MINGFLIFWKPCMILPFCLKSRGKLERDFPITIIEGFSSLHVLENENYFGFDYFLLGNLFWKRWECSILPHSTFLLGHLFRREFMGMNLCGVLCVKIYHTIKIWLTLSYWISSLWFSILMLAFSVLSSDISTHYLTYLPHQMMLVQTSTFRSLPILAGSRNGLSN